MKKILYHKVCILNDDDDNNDEAPDKSNNEASEVGSLDLSRKDCYDMQDGERRFAKVQQAGP